MSLPSTTMSSAVAGEHEAARTISVIVPVYNSAATLSELVKRVESVVCNLSNEFEILLINDGSRDESWAGIAELSRSNPRVRGLDLMRNFGQHNALLAGIREARYDLIVTLDDDLQNPPEEIPRLVAKLDDGYDVVYGTPVKPEYGYLRGLATSITKLALKSAMGADAARSVSAYRVFRTPIRDAFCDYRGPFVSIDVLLTWGTSRFGTVPVTHSPRAVGGSNYTFRRLATHALNMATGFSTVPLQLASLVGFVFSLFGLAVLLDVIVRRLVQGNAVPGFAFIASIIAIFAGAQLFALGIIGEYLARMYFRVMDKPSYAVRLHTEHGEDP